MNPLIDKSPLSDDATFRQIMLDYVDKAVAAHMQRNDKALTEFWSFTFFEDHSNWRCGTYLPRKMPTYWDTKLRKEIMKGKSLGVDINSLTIVEHPTIKSVYGQTLKVKLTVGDNTDIGYMFMVWDFRNPDKPQIHIRTWQPEYLDKAKTQKLDCNDVFTLADFDLF